MKPIKLNYQSVYVVWLVFRRGKNPSLAIDEFAYDLEDNISTLSNELSGGNYRHGEYQKLVIKEKKRRDLAVAIVRDRVVHRLLYDYLVAAFDKSFDPDVWSCRTGKGLHKCLVRTKNLLRKHSNSYVWRADITKFFDNVNHRILLNCLARKISHDKNAIRLCAEVIRSYNYQKPEGIPIGNLTSQVFANIYLHEFDRFVRHQLKPQAYLRYGDDFIVFCSTRKQAYEVRNSAKTFLLDSLGLAINPKNDVVVPAKSGLKFLGHAISQNYIVTDKHTTKNVLSKIDWHNAASYKSLPLVKQAKNQLDWILLEKYVDI